MTRKELQLKLRDLYARKDDAIRNHDKRLSEIAEAQNNAIAQLEDRKATFMQHWRQDKRNCDSITRKAYQDENTRFKLVKTAIANDERQLFADYKTQGYETKTEEANPIG